MVYRVKELRHSNKAPPSAGPTEASTEDILAKDNEAHTSSSDLMFLNQVCKSISRQILSQ